MCVNYKVRQQNIIKLVISCFLFSYDKENCFKILEQIILV